MGDFQGEKNPVLDKFVRLTDDGASWVSVGESGSSVFDILVEVDKAAFLDTLKEKLCKALSLSTASEKLMLDFLFKKGKKFDIREESVFIDLEGAQKHTEKSIGKTISKTSFQRSMKCFSQVGLVYPTGERSWFFLNPDIFCINNSFSVRTQYVVRSKTKKCDKVVDFFGDNEYMLVPR